MTSKLDNCIRWLHLSDFHLRCHDQWSQDVVLRSLLDDIANRHANSEQIDFIFITGDLTWSGQSAEYALVEKFLADLLSVTGVPPERLMLVPGNHDIDRNEEEDAFRGARAQLKNIIEVDNFLRHEGRRKTLFRRQKAFREFANRICNREIYSDSSFCHLISTQAGSITVAIMLIDSSWLAAGGSSDSHTIVVGEKQLIDMVKEIPHAALTIGLIHHPISWLAPFEHVPIQNLIVDNCHMLFRGHVHEDSVELISRLRNSLNVFTAGASYETRLSNNCYGYGFIDLLDGCGQCVIHRYRNDSKSWTQQESIPWTLIEQPNINLSLATTLPIIQSTNPLYPHYLTCLIGQKISDIPVCLDEQILFLSFYDEMASTSPIGQCIRKLRHILHWRECWDDRKWNSELVQLIQSYSTLVDDLSKNSEVQSELRQRDVHCEKMIRALSIASPDQGQIINIVQQAEALASSELFDTALAILRRAIEQGILSASEIIATRRLQIKIHLSRKKYEEANECSDELLSYDSIDGNDHLLVATCRLNVDNLSDATFHIKRARELGIPFSELKGLAVRVAGQTGDSKLIDELRG